MSSAYRLQRPSDLTAALSVEIIPIKKSIERKAALPSSTGKEPYYALPSCARFLAKAERVLLETHKK